MVHRAYYTFLAMGHDLAKTKVLDGSITDWKAAGGPVEEKPTSTFFVKDLHSSADTSTRYQASGPRQVVDKQKVMEVVVGQPQALGPTNTLIIDARSSERFYAKAPEPREGLRRGHMPGAKNVFFASLLRPENLNRMLPRDTLTDRFQQAGIPLEDASTNFVITCGSGATACTVAAAMIECGVDPARISVYDGSWMEWGADDSTPIVTTDD